MFDYAINDLEYNIDWFAELFIKSGYAKQFERGNPSVISGMSGIELAKRIIEYAYHETPNIPATQTIDRTPEYWAGWVLADYQWYSAYRFTDIFEKVKMSKIIELYRIYHIVDISLFREKLNSLMATIINDTKLKQIREANGLSQSELSKISGVNLRSIQMYEQRKNDIDKAQGQTLYKLSVVLCCEIEDLLEQPNK